MASDPIPHPRALADQFASELARVLGALVGGSASVAPVADRVTPAWTVGAALSGAATGRLTLGLTRADAAKLVQLAMGADAAPEDGAVADMLWEASAQAFSALGQHPIGGGLQIEGSGVQQSVPEQIEGDLVAYTLTLTSEFAPTIGVWVLVEQPAATAVSASYGAAIGRPALVSARDAHRQEPADRGGYPANLDVILDIDLPLSVRFGETELTMDVLTRLGPGSVIDLGRSPDDPVDVLVNGRLIARGEVVVVSGNYGVRILEVVSAADRVRSFGV
jgi:flagellar motor switch protein FliN